MDSPGNTSENRGGVITTPRIRFSTQGRVFLFLGFFLVVAATNTGNNLLFLAASGCLSLVIASALMAFRNLSGLRVEVGPPPEGFAGSSLRLKLRLVETTGANRYDISVLGWFIPALTPFQSIFVEGSLACDRRGKFQLPPLRCKSLFPFGMFETTLGIEPGFCWFFPSPREGRLADSERETGSLKGDSPATDGDFWMQRAYITGEDARNINWQTSSRSETEWVTTRSYPRQEPLAFWLDTCGRDGRSAEEFLQLACGFIVSLHQNQTSAFAWLPGKESGEGTWLSLSIPANLKALFRWMAELDASSPNPPPPFSDWAGSTPVRLHPGSFLRDG